MIVNRLILNFTHASRTYTELDGDREELNARLLGDLSATGDTRQVDIAGLDKALATSNGLEQLVGKTVILSAAAAVDSHVGRSLPVASVGHGQGSRTSTVLGLDDLIATKLYPVDKGVVLVGGDRDARLDLAEERHDGLARVTPNNGDVQLLRVSLAGNLGDEGFSADNVKGGDTEQTLGVEDTLGLQDLSRNGDGGVDGIGDNQNEGLRGNLSGDLNEALDDASVDVEQIITGHAGLACSQLLVNYRQPWISQAVGQTYGECQQE